MDRAHSNGYKFVYKDVAKVDANGVKYVESVGMYVPMSKGEIADMKELDRQMGGCLLTIFGIWFVYKIIRLIYRLITKQEPYFD